MVTLNNEIEDVLNLFIGEVGIGLREVEHGARLDRGGQDNPGINDQGDDQQRDRDGNKAAQDELDEWRHKKKPSGFYFTPQPCSSRNVERQKN